MMGTNSYFDARNKMVLICLELPIPHQSPWGGGACIWAINQHWFQGFSLRSSRGITTCHGALENTS